MLLDVSGSVAQEYEDVVYLKNGGVRRGLILEQIPGESIKLKTSYGEIFVIEMLDISKIGKEEKKLTKRIIYGSEERSKSKLESWYVRNNSLWNYFLLIALTIFVILSRSTHLIFRCYSSLPRPPAALNTFISSDYYV